MPFSSRIFSEFWCKMLGKLCEIIMFLIGKVFILQHCLNFKYTHLDYLHLMHLQSFWLDFAVILPSYLCIGTINDELITYTVNTTHQECDECILCMGVIECISCFRAICKYRLLFPLTWVKSL